MTRKRTFLAIWLAAALYAYIGIDCGWIPHDEGQFFQTADRVNAGEIPHRDFDEMYTGGLTYVHALAHRWLGDTFISLRWVLLGSFILWVPAVFYLASRFGSPIMAAGVTALAVVWSVPNYPAPVPSWYNLFLAVFGAAAVVRFIDTRRVRWLFVAGLCGGLSFLVKLVALYYVAGVLLFLLLREQSDAWEHERERSAARSRAYSIFLSLGLLTFIAFLTSIVLPAPSLGGLLLFVVPGAAIALILLLRERQLPPGSTRDRAMALARLVAPFAAGVAMPIGLYFLAFAMAGSWSALYHGLFVAPQERLEFASFPTPAFSVRRCAPILVLVAIAMTRWRSTAVSRASVAVVAILLGAVLVLSASPSMYLTSWRPVVFILAIVVVAGVLPLRVAGPLSNDQQTRALVIFVAATASLVQYPFPAPIYFCYVAPLVALTTAAASTASGRRPHPIATLLMVFYILFAVFRLAPGFIYRMGRSYEPVTLKTEMTPRRAKGIRVSADEARIYDRVIALVSAHSRSRPIYAFPDAPEIYVLAETSYPGRTIYEFLADPPITDATVLEYLSRESVQVVVIKKTPRFSDPPSDELLAELRKRYPLGETVGTFEVRWLE